MTLESTVQTLVASGLHRPGPQAEYERTVLATGSTGSSSIVVSLEDVASVWLEQLDILKDVDLKVSAPDYTDKKFRLKMAFPDMSLFIDAVEMGTGDENDDDPEGESEDSFRSQPQVTLKLIQQLPDPKTCAQLLDHLEVTMRMHPSFNFPNYRRRVEAMFDLNLYTTTPYPPPADPPMTLCDEGTSPSSRNGKTSAPHDETNKTSKAAKTSNKRPTLAFFAAAAGGLALGARTAMTPLNSSPGFNTQPSAGGFGASPASTSSSHPDHPDSHQSGNGNTARTNIYTSLSPIPAQSRTTHGAAPNLTMSQMEIQRAADGLFMLSKQALAVTEFEEHYDLDFIAAIILNGLFLLHDGKPRVAHTIYPTVGKLINICRLMGLHIDPDEFPGKYSLFDAEARRRTWWDVYYYDL